MCRRRAWIVALLACASSAWALRHAFTTLKIDTDRNAMLSPELPFRQDAEALRAAFPGLSNGLVLVVDGDVPERARAGALELAERLRARTDLFEDVYVPRADPFLESAALLFLDTDSLGELAQRLNEVQPFLGRLTRDPTPRALFTLLAQAYDSQTAASLPLEPVAQRIADVLAARRGGTLGSLSWQELLTPTDAEPNANAGRQIVLARVRPDFGRLFPAGPAIRFVRGLRDELGWNANGELSFAITGQPALAHEELETVQRGSRTIGLLVVVLVAAALSFGLRSWRLVLASLLTLAVGLSWTAGFAAVAIGRLNLISVAFAVLFLGLGADFAIHFALRFREALDTQPDAGQAWRATARDVGGSLAVCAVTTALGFFSFVPTAYSGVSELGAISGVGMLIAFSATVTLFPAWMTILPLHPGGAPRPSRWLAVATARHARPIRWGALLIGLAALAATPLVQFDRNPLSLRDPDSESVATFRDLLATSTTPPWSVNALTSEASKTASIAQSWSQADAIGRVVRLESFVPRNQDEKLDLLFDLSLELGDLTIRPDAPAAPLNEELESLRALQRALSSMPTQGDGTRALAHEIDALLPVYDSPVAADVEQRLLGTLRPNLERLSGALQNEGFELSDLPAALSARWVAEDGTRRVEAFSRGDLDDLATMRRFVDEVRDVTPHATGSPVMILESGDAVVGAFRQAFLIALVATLAVLTLLLRSVRDVGLVLIPLGLAGLATTATLVLLDEPFNFANVIGLPLLLGIGVDSGVHVLHRARSGAQNPLGSSTQRAVVYSALTTLASFANLSFSPHPGTASMGRILAIGVAFTLLATLVVLPACLRREAPEATNGSL